MGWTLLVLLLALGNRDVGRPSLTVGVITVGIAILRRRAFDDRRTDLALALWCRTAWLTLGREHIGVTDRGRAVSVGRCVGRRTRMLTGLHLRMHLRLLLLLLELLLIRGLLRIGRHGLHPLHALLLHELLLHHRVDCWHLGPDELWEGRELDGRIESGMRLRKDRHVGLELGKVVVAQQADAITDIFGVEVVNDESIIVPGHTHADTDSTARVEVVSSHLVESTTLCLPVGTMIRIRSIIRDVLVHIVVDGRGALRGRPTGKRVWKQPVCVLGRR